MVTDEERHEIAQRLREFSKNTWPLTVGGNSATIRYAISDIVFGDKKYHSGVDLLDRLANLIEPPLQCPLYHSDRHYCSIYEDVDVIDRDMLLALADEMDAYTKCDDERCGREMPPRVIHDFADRIREALGSE